MANTESNNDGQGSAGFKVSEQKGLKRMTSGASQKITPPLTEYPSDVPGVLSVDKDTCYNFGICISGSRGMLRSFEVNGTWKTSVMRQPVTEKDLDAAALFVYNCPLTAIRHDGDPFHPDVMERVNNILAKGSETPVQQPPTDQTES